MAEPAHDPDLWLREQCGVATRQQLESAGLSESRVRAQLAAGRWRELNERVIVTHNGPLTWQQQLWAVDLSATDPHAMTGLTAMQMWGIRGFETGDIHVLVAHGGRVLGVDRTTVVVHESRRFTATDIWRGRAPQLVSLPRATVDSAVWSGDLWTAYRVFVSPVQQRKALATEMHQEISRTTRVRHRRQLLALANDLCGGAEALSEVEFLRFCRRHDLPRPRCQRRMGSGGRWRYLDATFTRKDGTLLRVEIDGGVHLSLAVRSRDTLKDNWANLDGRLVLRFASAAIYADDPEVVAQIRQGLASVSA